MSAIVATVFLSLLSLPISGQSEHSNELEKALNAFKEARELGHKATAFIHARASYRAARKQYLKTPIKLTTHALNYATAAAALNDPIAFKLYQNALDIYVSVYGIAHQKLTTPLIHAAEEALKQNETEVAYTWLKKAAHLLKLHFPKDNLSLSRVYMGRARLYLNVGDIEKASINAHKAIDIMTLSDNAHSENIKASLLYWLGEIERFEGNNHKALDAYSRSLSLFMQRDSEAREIYDLHKRLVEINHQLGLKEKAKFHCKNAMNYRFGKTKTEREPFYDPNGRLTRSNNQKQGQIRATLVKGADCRLRNIEIHHTIGITHAEALSLLKQTYYTPIVMNGIISDGEYSSLVTLNIYENQ